MNLTVESHLESCTPHELPFSRKPRIVLTRLLKKQDFKEYISKNITIAASDRAIFEEVLAQLKDYLKELEGAESELDMRGVSVEVVEQAGRVSYDITRTFIKCNKLLECLLEQQQSLSEMLAPLLRAYLQSANLNHIVCSANNLFYTTRLWSQHPTFQFNFTSLGFPFDILKGKAICRSDLIEYANYLPPTFFQLQPKERFNFVLKVRSLAINLLVIVLRRDINFIRNEVSAEQYSFQQFQGIVQKVQSCFQELLENESIKHTIEAAAKAVNVDLLYFFKVVILHSNSNQFYQFNSWPRVVRFFNLPLLASYQAAFELQCPRGSSGLTYLEGWVRQLWEGESQFTRRRFSQLGISVEGSRDELILYLLYRHKLINEPHFVSLNQLYHPQFLRVIIGLYQQIIFSDFLLSPAPLSSLQARKDSRNEQLIGVIKSLSEFLNETGVLVQKGNLKQKKKILFVSNQNIDFKKVMEKCWHSGLG